MDQQNNAPGSVHAAAPPVKDAASKSKIDEELQGVFVVRNKKATFVPVTTGITGRTDIEVLDGLKEGTRSSPAVTRCCGAWTGEQR